MLCAPLIGLFFKLPAAVAHHIPHDHGNGFIELLIGSLLRRHAEEVGELGGHQLICLLLRKCIFHMFPPKNVVNKDFKSVCFIYFI